MTRLTVNIAVNSSYLVDLFQVQRRLETVGSNGRATPSVVLFNAVAGVVYADGDNHLDTERDSRRNKKTIAVVTKFALRSESLDAQGATWEPDIIVWHGNSFIVEDLEEYSSYGPGFVEAQCCMIDMSAQPPGTGGGIVLGTSPLVVTNALRQFPLTQQSSTVFTVTIVAQQALLFRNGLLQSVPTDYNITSTLSGSTVILVQPLVPGESLAFYAY